MTQMIRILKERSGGAVWKAIPIMTTAWACAVKDVGVGPLSVGIAVITGGVTSMTCVVEQGFSVPIVSRHLFIPSGVLASAVIPNAWAEVFGGNNRCHMHSFQYIRA